MWLGYCIADWARVEELIFLIFRAAVQTPKETAELLYYRNKTLSGRLSLTNEVVRAAIVSNQVGVKSWTQIEREIESLLATRNRLAHHPVALRDERHSINEDSSGFSELIGVAWAESFVPEGERSSRKKKHPDVLKIGDLKLHHSETEFVRLRLYNFLNEMLLTPPPERR
jgi:hypothetical protein